MNNIKNRIKSNPNPTNGHFVSRNNDKNINNSTSDNVQKDQKSKQGQRQSSSHFSSLDQLELVTTTTLKKTMDLSGQNYNLEGDEHNNNNRSSNNNIEDEKTP